MKKIALSLLSCFFLTGCVLGSMKPFFTPDLVVDTPELYGTWAYEKTVEPNDKSYVVLAPGKITLVDDSGIPGDSKLTFFKVGDQLFVDLFPDEGMLRNDLVGPGDPVHLVCLVQHENGKLLFNPLDYEWLVKEIQAGTIDLPFKKASEDPEANIVLTATPEQWVGFLKSYAKNPQAFPHSNEGWLIRKE